MTREIAEAAKALRIAIHDRLVAGRGGTVSFKSLGLLSARPSKATDQLRIDFDLRVGRAKYIGFHDLCQYVCPIMGCIEMHPVDTGKPYLTWSNHPNNPMR